MVLPTTQVKAMKKITQIILCVCASTSVWAQNIIEPTPGFLNAPSGYVTSITQAEVSPLNQKFKGTPRLVEQFYPKKLRLDADAAKALHEAELQKTMEQFTFVHSSYNTADVFNPTQAIISTPPLNATTEKITSQAPGRVGLGNQSGVLTPSDAQIAAGPYQIVVLANDNARILNKQTGSIISEVTLAAMFNLSGFVFDPRIFYDPFGQRFVALALTRSGPNGCSPGNIGSTFRILVSNNSDITQGWYFYDIDVDATNTAWLDFAMLGFNKDWICIAGNILCSNTVNGIFVMNKAQTYNAGQVNYFTFPQLWLAAPAFTYDNTIDRLYLTKTGNPNNNGLGYMQTYYINSAPQLVTSNSYATSPWQANASDSSRCPKQLGGQTFTWVNVFGASMLSNSVYRNGNLWCTHPVFLPATGLTNRSSTLFWSVNPVAGTISQAGFVDDPTGATSTYYPSIAVNSANDAVVTYSIFNAGYYQSAAYNARNAADPLGTLPNGVFYQNGFNTDIDGRGADYSQCAIDPLDDMSMWVVNQVASGDWETYYALLPAYYGCFTNTTFGNSFWSGNTKNEASGSITSAEMISSLSMVDYDAGTEVILSNGFIANYGCVFNAYIDGCNGYRIGNSKPDDNTAKLTNENNASMVVFPNPAQNEFFLNLKNIDGEVLVKVFDTQMQLIKQVKKSIVSENAQSVLQLDASFLSTGIYYVQIENRFTRLFEKLIVIH